MHRGRETVRHPGADDHPRVPALQHDHAAVRGLPGGSRDALPLPHAHPAEEDPRPGPPGQHRRARRHAPAHLEGRGVPGPWTPHRRRGAEVRRGPERKTQTEVPERGRADPVGHAHPADTQYGDERHPRHVDHRRGAAGPPPGPDVRPRVRHRHHRAGDREGTAPRRSGLLPLQQCRGHLALRRKGARTRAGGAHRHRPRQDVRRAAVRGLAGPHGRRDRHPRLHDDHRDRRRHPERQHADHRERRPLRPLAAAPDPRPHRPLLPSRLRLLHVLRRQGTDGHRAAAPLRHPRIHRIRLRLQDRHARPRTPRRRLHPRRAAARPHGGGRLRHVPEDPRGSHRRTEGAEWRGGLCRRNCRHADGRF